jgi:hypothetical protein
MSIPSSVFGELAFFLNYGTSVDALKTGTLSSGK